MKIRKAEGKLADFEIRDRRASVEGKEMMKGVTLAINRGAVQERMVPNGRGKYKQGQTRTEADRGCRGFARIKHDRDQRAPPR